MNKAFILVFIFIIINTLCASGQDSLQVTHYALHLNINVAEKGFLKISDNFSNVYFQGIYEPGNNLLPVAVDNKADSLLVFFKDSVQVIPVNENKSEIFLNFASGNVSWQKKLRWFWNDFLKAFPIITFVIIFVIMKQKERRKNKKPE